MNLFNKEPTFDIVGKIGLFRVLSATLILISVGSIATLGLNFGIDFAGGYEIQVKFSKSVNEAEIKSALAPLGLEDARVQRFGDVEANEYLVMVREQASVSAEQRVSIKADFEELAGGPANLTSLAIAESGENISVEFGTNVSEESVRGVLEKHSLVLKSITKGAREDKAVFAIQLMSLADDVEKSLVSALKIPPGEQIVKRVEFVGPQVGAELRNQGIMAVVYALGFILLYISIRFDFFFAPGAIFALVHDVLITVGIFSVFGLEFNLPIIAAILALVGYSLNDTIVVYDRIRENALRLRGRALRDLVNTSINQTLSRTILTSVTTLMVVLALIVFGGGIIRYFSIALLIGVVVGTYSSVAIAAPTYILLRERSEAAGASRGASKKSAASNAV